MASKKAADMLEILQGVESSAGNKKKAKLSFWNDKEMGSIVSFGIPSVDTASNIGGHKRGDIIEIFGPESSGKSYTAYKMMAQYQAQGLNVALLDVEHAFWGPWVAKAGVNLAKVVYGQDFESGEQTMLYAQKMAESGAFGIIVIDSIAALLPQSEANSSLDENARVGAHAAMMSRCLRTLMGVMSRTETTLVCINQTRVKIGVMFGNPEDTPGGKALKFYAGMRIGLQFIGKEMAKVDGVDKPVGIRTKVKFIKNKVGQPFGEDEMVIYHVEGINTPMVQLVNLAIRLRVVPGRKAFDEDNSDKKLAEKKTYVWKDSDGDPQDTSCTTASDLADWFEANDLVPTVVDMVIAKAKIKGVEVPPEVLLLKASDTSKTPAEVTEDPKA